MEDAMIFLMTFVCILLGGITIQLNGIWNALSKIAEALARMKGE